MSTKTVIVLCMIVPLLLSGFFNHYGHKNWILYFPVAGIALAVIYFGHVGIRSLNKSNQAPSERPYVTITDSRLERAIAAGDYPTFYCVVKNGPFHVKGTIRNVTVYWCSIQEQVFPYGDSLTKSFDLMPNEPTNVIFRFNEYIFTQEKIDALNQDKARLLFYFRGEYTDDYGRTYPMKHCFIWNKYLGTNLALCGDDIKLE